MAAALRSWRPTSACCSKTPEAWRVTDLAPGIFNMQAMQTKPSQPSSRLPAQSFYIADLFRAEEIAAMGAAIHETVDRVAKALRTPYAESAG